MPVLDVAVGEAMITNLDDTQKNCLNGANVMENKEGAHVANYTNSEIAESVVANNAIGKEDIEAASTSNVHVDAAKTDNSTIETMELTNQTNTKERIDIFDMENNESSLSDLCDVVEKLVSPVVENINMDPSSKDNDVTEITDKPKSKNIEIDSSLEVNDTEVKNEAKNSEFSISSTDVAKNTESPKEENDSTEFVTSLKVNEIKGLSEVENSEIKHSSNNENHTTDRLNAQNVNKELETSSVNDVTGKSEIDSKEFEDSSNDAISRARSPVKEDKNIEPKKLKADEVAGISEVDNSLNKTSLSISDEINKAYSPEGENSELEISSIVNDIANKLEEDNSDFESLSNAGDDIHNIDSPNTENIEAKFLSKVNDDGKKQYEPELDNIEFETLTKLEAIEHNENSSNLHNKTDKDNGSMVENSNSEKFDDFIETDNDDNENNDKIDESEPMDVSDDLNTRDKTALQMDTKEAACNGCISVSESNSEISDIVIKTKPEIAKTENTQELVSEVEPMDIDTTNEPVAQKANDIVKDKKSSKDDPDRMDVTEDTDTLNSDVTPLQTELNDLASEKVVVTADSSKTLNIDKLDDADITGVPSVDLENYNLTDADTSLCNSHKHESDAVMSNMGSNRTDLDKIVSEDTIFVTKNQSSDTVNKIPESAADVVDSANANTNTILNTTESINLNQDSSNATSIVETESKETKVNIDEEKLKIENNSEIKSTANVVLNISSDDDECQKNKSDSSTILKTSLENNDEIIPIHTDTLCKSEADKESGKEAETQVKNENFRDIPTENLVKTDVIEKLKSCIDYNKIDQHEDIVVKKDENIIAETDIKLPENTMETAVKEENDEETKTIESPKNVEPKPLLSRKVIEGFSKKITGMTHEELEEFSSLKIVEGIINACNLNELKAKIKSLTDENVKLRNEAADMAKHYRDIQLVVKSVQDEQKRRTEGKVKPLRLVRSVGLQVNLITETKPEPPARGKLKKPQPVPKHLVPTNIPPTRTNAGAIPLPRLVPAPAKTPVKIKPAQPSQSPSPTTTKPQMNGIRNPPPPPAQNKRPFSSLQTVDLTDDEPPPKQVAITRNATNQQQSRQSPSNTQKQIVHRTPQQVANPRNLYVPINNPQGVPIRPGQMIFFRSPPNGPGQRPRAPISNVRMPINARKLVVSPRHPAALPEAPRQPYQANRKPLPPGPELKISKIENGIVISWKIDGYPDEKYSEILSYQLFSYQETNLPPSTSLWKKIGDVKALPLPMACTLTQFVAGYKYYFAVRAVDNTSRIGPFSLPGSILLLNKKD